jgi:hypothetical protein
MIKTSTTHYVSIRLFQLFGEKCIPLGETRTTEDGTVEAKFFQISGSNPEREIWLRREDIY